MNAREMLRQAAMKTAASCSGGRPDTNAPPMPEHPGNPDTNAKGQKKVASVDRWLHKLAAQKKVAARRPGRLDGDETLDKLASLRSKKKQRTCS
jgi:hypothetical protein